MKVKLCHKCHQTKPVSEFYKSKTEKDGYRNRCKQCSGEDRKLYAQAIDYDRKYQGEYLQKPEVKEQIRNRTAEYRKRPDIRIKNLARWYTNHEIRAGRINREPCALCGVEQGEAHHLDYNQPLIIVWLCANCHRQIHLKDKYKKGK